VRSLTLKLTFAFLLTGLVSVALAAIFARYFTGVEFNRFVGEREVRDFSAAVAGYYEQHGSWAGVDTYLRLHPPPGSPDSALPPPGGAPPFLLVGMDGRALTSGGGYRPGTPVPPNLIAGGSGIMVGGRRVATVVVLAYRPILNERDRDFLARASRTLIYGAIGGGVVALLIGLVLTRVLLRPILALTDAIRAMHQGAEGLAVPVASQDEIGELVQAFNQLSADLARSNQARRQMTADIAHDLRTPLSVLTGYIETLRDEILPPSRERFQAMAQEATLLQRLIDDLRLLSLADAGELPLQMQHVAPDRLLMDVALAFEQQATRRGVSLDLQIDDDMPLLHIDRERMQQVLGNLVGNALRYTPPEGMITLAATRTNRGTQIEVADTGQGAPPDALPYLFERLYRADQARNERDGGSGLGLAIARAIVEAHGGNIAARNDPGAGLRVTITLP
jgi:signal transduction histidine kinase